MKLLVFFLVFSLQGFAVGLVWIGQWSTKDTYEVADSGVLQCNISSHKETVERCRISWVIINPTNKKRTKDIRTVERYQHRVQIKSSSYFSSMTLNNLSENDSEPLFCTASCFIDGTLTQISGNGTSLMITERKPEHPHPWLKYLLFSVNILIFFTATFICGLIIRTRIQNKEPILL